MARAPKALAVEGAPAEPDLLDNQVPPREMDRLVGHREAREALAAAFASAPPQALLLEGPRGIGKATFAFRLAKTLLSGAPVNADLASDPEERNVRQVSAGTHPSLLHLTRAYDEKAKRFKSELSVDTVRRIVPFLGSSAAGGGWRVVIVDAVDDMNLNAANALLKSLEEPPRRTLFLLIAHISGRVLPTIRSRCRAVRLRPLAQAEVGEALAALGADTDLSDAAEGSVRRALGLSSAGADAVRAAQKILSGRFGETRQRFALADLAAQKRGELFAVICDLTLDAIAERARRAAARAPLETVDTYAATYLEALAERRRVEIYNLDRKEFILSLTDRLAKADAAARGA